MQSQYLKNKRKYSPKEDDDDSITEEYIYLKAKKNEIKEKSENNNGNMIKYDTNISEHNKNIIEQQENNKIKELSRNIHALSLDVYNINKKNKTLESYILNLIKARENDRNNIYDLKNDIHELKKLNRERDDKIK